MAISPAASHASGWGSLAAGLISIAAAASWLAGGSVFMPLVVAGGFAFAVLALFNPVIPVLLLLAVSVFRIPEVFTALLPFSLPLASAALVFAALGIRGMTGAVRLSWPLELRLFIALFALALLGIPLGLNPSASIKQLSETYAKVLLLVVALAWLMRRPEDFRALVLVILLSGLAIGWRAITNYQAGVDLVEGTRVAIGLEFESILSDPNDLALVMLIPLCFALAVLEFRRRMIWTLLAVGCAAASLYTILLTQSRGGLLGIIAIAVVFASRRIRSKVLLLVVGAIAGVVLYYAMGIADRSSGGAAEAGFGQAAEIRLDLWKISLRTMLEYPIFGVGLGNFPIISLGVTGRSWVSHNSWAQVGTEVGLPGLTLFALMFLVAIHASYRTLKAAEAANAPWVIRAAALGLLAALCGVCISMTFLSQAFSWITNSLIGISAALSAYAALNLPATAQDQAPIK